MPAIWEHSVCKDCWPRGSIPWPEGWLCRLQADLESIWGMTIQPTARSSITPWCPVWLLVGGVSVVMSYVCLAGSVNNFSFIPVSSILFFSVCIFLFCPPLLFGLFYISLSFSSVLVLYCFVFSWFVLFYLVVYGICLKYRAPCALCEEIIKFGTDDLWNTLFNFWYRAVIFDIVWTSNLHISKMAANR